MIETCPDCESFPPHIVVTQLTNGDLACECRDCGGYWEELSNPQDFFQNTDDEDRFEKLGGFDIDDEVV